MKFSNHVLVRYVQRVKGIEDEKEAQKYVDRNKYEVSYKLLQFVNDSKLLYDRLPYKGSSEVTEYRLNGDILIVIATNTDTVITLYDIVMDLDERGNEERLRVAAKKIGHNRYELMKAESKKKKNDAETLQIKATLDYLEEQAAKVREKWEASVQVSRGYKKDVDRYKEENIRLMDDIMFGFKKIKD